MSLLHEVTRRKKLLADAAAPLRRFVPRGRDHSQERDSVAAGFDVLRLHEQPAFPIFDLIGDSADRAGNTGRATSPPRP